jgi:hypothetical protein
LGKRDDIDPLAPLKEERSQYTGENYLRRMVVTLLKDEGSDFRHESSLPEAGLPSALIKLAKLGTLNFELETEVFPRSPTKTSVTIGQVFRET